MNVTVNGQQVTLDAPMSLKQLLDKMGYGNHQVAVALNTDFVPRTDYGRVSVKEGDAVDIVAPIQGG